MDWNWWERRDGASEEPSGLAPRSLRRKAAPAACWAHRLLVGACVLAAISCGCKLNLSRTRVGNPLNEAEYNKLTVGKSTRGEALEKLGAPEKVEWKNGKDYLWYLYADTVGAGLRFQFPPFRSLFGYQHTFLRLNEDSEDVNAMELVFDEGGLLEQKSLRLSKEYQKQTEPRSGWTFHVTPRFEHSVYIMGDGGIRDYSEIFHNGYRTGLELGFEPFPVLTILAGGYFQEHEGKKVHTNAGELSFHDLNLYEMEAGIRLAFPLELFFFLDDFDAVKRVLFEESRDKPQGFSFYFQGTTGPTITNNVPVKIDGIRAGNFYDGDLIMAGTGEAGIEYIGKWGGAYLGVAFQTMDAFDKGSSPLDDEGGAFETILLCAGLGFRL